MFLVAGSRLTQAWSTFFYELCEIDMKHERGVRATWEYREQVSMQGQEWNCCRLLFCSGYQISRQLIQIFYDLSCLQHKLVVSELSDDLHASGVAIAILQILLDRLR